MRRSEVMLAFFLILVVVLSGCNQSDQSVSIGSDSVLPREAESLELVEAEEKEAAPEKEVKEEEITEKISVNPEDYTFGPFLGKLVLKANLLRPIVVMIENAPAARPQAGLAEASIVYEYLVEGGITRFAAIFYEDFPKIIGPVRSTRPYFIDLALEYDALLLHAGASPEGFSQLADSPVDHLDELTNSDFYWRSSTRRSPHNLYTGKAQIESYLARRESGVIPEARFPFQKVSFVNQTDMIKATEVKIYYWGGYTVNYKYDQFTGSYLRFIDGLPHLLEGGQKIFADNILIQYVDTKVNDDAGRLNMQMFGSDRAVLIKDGFADSGSWRKGADSMTRFYDSSGQEWSINPGQTWIQVVPKSTIVEYR